MHYGHRICMRVGKSTRMYYGHTTSMDFVMSVAYVTYLTYAMYVMRVKFVMYVIDVMYVIYVVSAMYAMYVMRLMVRIVGGARNSLGSARE